MKEIRVKNTVYIIENQDEEIDLAHELARQGYDINQIAQILNIGKRKVIRYMQECWG